MGVPRRFLSLLVASAVCAGVALTASTPAPVLVYSHTAERTSYLANAVIWKDPGPPLAGADQGRSSGRVASSDRERGWPTD